MRRDPDRRRPQRPCLRRLSRQGRAQGHRARAPRCRRRRRGHRGIPSGFRNSVAAYTVSLLQPKVIRDLDLGAHGLKIVQRKLNNFLPLPDGPDSKRNYLATGAGRTQAEVAKFSRRDAERLPDYERRLEAIADVLRALALEPPPNVTDGGWLKALPGIVARGATRQAGEVAGRDPAHGLCSICSRSRPPNTWIASSRANRSRRCSASTASSATTRARSRRAARTCCCITCSAK